MESKFFSSGEKITLMMGRQGGTKLHSHDFIEMVYVTKGCAEHILNDTCTTVKKGDYFIIEYGAFHKYNTIKNMEFEIINTLFMPEIIDKALTGCKSFRDLINNYLIRFSYKALEKSPTNFIFHDNDNYIFTLIEKLKNEFLQKGPGYMELMRCHLIEIIVKTMRKISKEDAVLYDDYSKYIINYIDENYMNPITLSKISEKLSYSLPYLSKKFKNDVGLTFNDYLQKKRMEQSLRLLANTDKKIAEIAELVGYKDTKFFNQVFKKQLKMNPREFKRLHK